MQANTSLAILVTLLGACLMAACSKTDDPESAASPEPAATEAALSVDAPVALPRTASPEGARVFFISPADGDIVSNPFLVEFGVAGMAVVKAGEMAPDSGHHHLLIDTDMPNPDLPIPADANHRHFGDASTSTELTLEPGQHTLQLLLADHLHIPHNPPVVSASITITVE